jgi:hypothetical protein
MRKTITAHHAFICLLYAQELTRLGVLKGEIQRQFYDVELQYEFKRQMLLKYGAWWKE